MQNQQYKASQLSSIVQEDLSKIIYDYLNYSGFGEAAVSFVEETGLQGVCDEQNTDSLKSRERLRKLIFAGKTEEALLFLDKLYPSNKNFDFNLQKYKLLQQHFIELCRQRKLNAAVNFSQDVLVPYYENLKESNPNFEDFLEKLFHPKHVMIFLLVEDPAQVPQLKESYSIKNRQNIFFDLNEVLVKETNEVNSLEDMLQTFSFFSKKS
eukprot:maker-scaffold_5-snap-gene-2.41-mRNA-1 protein AED:0.23 eAED:0.23 QI:65/0.5/0.33/1/1/1/3/0/209